ncbi:globin domain-containing protein [Streptomyces sp. HC307]|uniref:globin domain-containing protein n=1 Tax=Streptomyces flavusporus TaxID=3385496 RepID=UPI0039174B37
MFEARHTMDAPTTTSADNGTSDGGGGWFTPRKKPMPTPGSERETADGRRLAAMRPVGRTTTGTDPEAPLDEVAQGATPQVMEPHTQAQGTGSPTSATHPEPRGYGAPGPQPAAADAGTDRERITAPAISTPAPAPARTEAPSAAQHVTAPAEAPPAAQGPSTTTQERPTTQRAPLPNEVPPAQPAPTPTAPPPPAHRVPAQRTAAEHTEPSLFAAGTAPAAGPASNADLPAPHAEPPAPHADQPTAHEDASPDAVLIRRTMTTVAPVADKVTSYFYALLFVRHPDLRPLFPAAMDAQRDRLLKALLTAAEHIDNADVLVPYLQNLGRGHRKYGTRPEHYPAVGECLIGALSRYAESVWDGETEAAWVRAYTTISQVMIDAAAADELRAPAWWYAEVVSHDLRTPDVAVITIRPDQPYPFLAGQYTSLETPWWPRIWRHYSFASAPRSDGLLSFHVKAVPAGWVSNALVHRARSGDVVRLGPPAGSMTVDHSTDSGLLCLGGGTGIAPIKALVEDVAEHGERRPVEVFYGARTDHDLYDIDTMLRLQQTHPWLSVRAIIDQQAHLQLPDAIRAYGPWNEYDAYLSGPPGMIRSGVDALRDAGIPSERIRHDSVEELVAAGS